MNIKIKIIIYLFLMTSNINCQEKKDTTIENINNMNDKIIETVLTKQLRQGTTYTIDEAGGGLPKIPFEMQELEATAQTANNILKSNGFKELTSEDFNQKIKSIFGRVIDYNSQSAFLYLNFLDKCDREFIMYKNNRIDYSGTFIDKRRKLITDFYYIPELIDYQKAYPELNSIENTKIIRESSIDDLEIEIPHWKDIPDLPQLRQKNIQTLVSRNKYLFNNSKADFVWLRFNDAAFLESLVKIFGYDKDQDLNLFVLKNNVKDTEEFGKLLWHKDCAGKASLNMGIVESITSLSDEEIKPYMEQIMEWLVLVNGGYPNGKKIDMDIPFPQKAEILGKLGYYMSKREKGGYYYFQINNRINYPTYDAEFKKQNYYNIPDFQQIWEDTKDGGISYPDLNEANTKEKTPDLAPPPRPPRFQQFCQKSSRKRRCRIRAQDFRLGFCKNWRHIGLHSHRRSRERTGKKPKEKAQSSGRR